MRQSERPRPTLRRPVLKRANMKRQGSQIILRISLILLGALATSQSKAQDLSAGARIHPGGVGRYAAGRWGLVGGTFANPNSTQAQDFTTVVMPPNGGGLQFGRRMRVPPGVSFLSEWPVFVPRGGAGNMSFEYLKFQEGNEDQVVQEQVGERLIQNFGTSLGSGTEAWAGVLDSDRHSEEVLHNLRRFSQVLRYQERQQEGLLALQLDRISDQPEVFEPLEYLSLSHEGLTNRPAVMDALRLWVQRGGRLVVAIDLAGTDVWNGLFGSTAPMTLVQETSSTDIKLQLNPSYSKTRHPISVVDKSYDEPVRYLRVIAENVEPIWSIDGWPVAIRLPFGEGEVVGLLIETRAIIEPKRDTGQGIPWKLIESGGSRLAEILYKLPDPDLINTDAILVQANHQIGYGIPSVTFPILIGFGFPVLLVGLGIWLYRRSCPEKLIWFVPVFAILVAVPPMIGGIRQRSVAPTTVAEYRTVRAIPGQSNLVADGTSVLYSPDSAPTSISSSGGTQHNPPISPGRRETRRQMTTSSGDRDWSRISFPSGLTPIPMRSSQIASQPMVAKLSFDEDGITGTVQTGSLKDASDLILAGVSPERMSLNLESDGHVSGGVDRLLAKDTFAHGTLISNQQRQREQTYRDIFNLKGRPRAFPETSTLLYWANHARKEHGIGDEDTVFTGTTLVAQPVQWIPPELDQSVVIPAPAIDYRSISNADGKYSSTYSNQNREWVSRESANDFLIEFRIPQACTPFEAQTIDCRIKIRAPARQVILSSGNSPTELSEFHNVTGPVGILNVQIPADSVQNSLQTGSFILKLDIGELNLNSDEDSSASGEQDDSWMVQQLQVNLKGRRVRSNQSTNAPNRSQTFK